MPMTLEAARLLRDGAIDAIDALDNALRDALEELSPRQYAALKHAVGRATEAIFDEIFRPITAAHPELEVSQTDWAGIARLQAAKRASNPGSDLVFITAKI